MRSSLIIPLSSPCRITLKTSGVRVNIDGFHKLQQHHARGQKAEECVHVHIYLVPTRYLIPPWVDYINKQ